ncbi:MAG: DNA repair protein RecO [Bacteroidetes bacterium]|nr:MAG: DNA repair protein RecO [Bacteroidota bacterium]
MLIKTQGIVLHSFKYGESGIIARILTREMGLQSFLVHGVRKAKAKNKANLFQPLTLVDLVAYYKQSNNSLLNIKEIQCLHHFTTIGTDIRKTTIALFLGEVLLNAFTRQEMHEQVFSFIHQAVVHLDEREKNLGAFHISFLLQLSRFLGFSPNQNYSEIHCFFNLMEGVYQKENDHPAYCLNKETSYYFSQLSSISIDSNIDFSIPSHLRKDLLQKTIDYYKLHIEGFKEVSSHHVLEEVFVS